MTDKDERAKRLAEELRKNLRRRKRQTRAATLSKPSERNRKGNPDRDDGADG